MQSLNRGSGPFRTTLLLAALLLAGSLAACSDSSAPAAGVAGTYNLQSVGGAAPPGIILESEDLTVELTGGRLVLGTDRSFLLRSEFRIHHAAGTSTDVEVIVGSYTQQGALLQFTENDSGDQWPGALQGTTITRSVGSTLVVYAR